MRGATTLSDTPSAAEQFAASIEADPAADSDNVAAAHVGGSFVTREFYRPALDRD